MQLWKGAPGVAARPAGRRVLVRALQDMRSPCRRRGVWLHGLWGGRACRVAWRAGCSGLQ